MFISTIANYIISSFSVSELKMAVVADCFTIGSKVACRTCYNQNIEGEVLAFDAHTKMLILKCPSSSGDTRLNDVNIVNLALVSDVQILQEVSVTPDAPQTLDLHRLDTRVKKQIEDKRRLVSILHISFIFSYSNIVIDHIFDLQVSALSCVDPEGQQLFLAIAKTITDVTWAGQNIQVFNHVTITPPYKVISILRPFWQIDSLFNPIFRCRWKTYVETQTQSNMYI